MKLYEKMNSGVYVIAEMSANHAGKIENAFKIIEEAAKAGADCVDTDLHGGYAHDRLQGGTVSDQGRSVGRL
mgnify:CR=1 FL=1